MKRMMYLVLLILVLCAALTGCSRAVRTPADELTMYRWESRMENGNTVSLLFGNAKAAFIAENEAFTLKISGYYLLDDSVLVISDTQTRMNCSFPYTLHGDCVELRYGDGTVTLCKNSVL